MEDLLKNDKMDAIEHESRLLSDICCSIGISNRQRKRNIQYTDFLATKNNIDLSNDFTATRIICGSQSEGITPVRLASDTLTDSDIMHMLGDINVQEHVDTTKTNQAEVLQMLYTDSPEHVLLEVKPYERKYKTFNNRSEVIKEKYGKHLVSSSLLKDVLQKGLAEYALSIPSVPYVSNVNDIRHSYCQSMKNLKQTTIHGPAVMAKHRPELDVGSIDGIYCLRCYEWPTPAHEWIDRARPHGWPSQDLIDQILYEGCELVPVGRKDHPDEDVQWKLSFSRAETRLIRNFNIYQAQCYQLLKIAKKHLISSVVADSLSSYHIKTVMLHTVEQTDPNVWRKDNLTQCFMMCLSNLKRYLTDKFLPQYFIVRQNLLEPKVTGDVHQNVLEIVTDLHKIGWKCILQFPELQRLCQSIQERVESIPYVVITDVYALVGNNTMIVNMCKSLLTHIVSQVQSVSYDCYLFRSVGLCGKTFLKPTSSQPSVETARVLQLLRKSTLGNMLTILGHVLIFAKPDHRPGIDPLMNFARQCLEESCHADVSSCRLKFATFLFHIGEYDQCKKTVHDVLERFKDDVWVVVGGLDTTNHECKEAFEKKDKFELQFKLDRILQLSDKGFPFISKHLSLPAFFTHWEVAVAPKGVQYVRKTMLSHNNVLFNEVCFIDSIVYAHYLLVESYLKIDEHDHAGHALTNMTESIRNVKVDMFDRNCLGFCEEDTLLLHYSEKLVHVTKNVKDKRKS